MKRLFLGVILLSFFAACSPKNTGPQGAVSKELTTQDWDRLISALVNNDWQTSGRLSEQYLKLYNKKDPGGEAARLRYMYIYSIAGQMGERTIDRKEGLKKVRKFIGLRVEMPSHPIQPSKDCIFNCFWPLDDDKTKIFTSAANKEGTFIHAFETFERPKGLDVENNRGKTLRLGGTLANIELRGQFLAAFGIEVKDCYFEMEE